VTITASGVKEALNQPHKHYFSKNESIKNIEAILPASTFIESKADSSGDSNNVFHYFKTTLNGEDSYIVLKEIRKEGKIVFYSIVDKIKK